MSLKIRLARGGDVSDSLIEAAEADGRSLVEIDDGKLVRIPLPVLGQQIGHGLIRDLRTMLPEYARHGISLNFLFCARVRCSAASRSVLVESYDTGQRSCTIRSNCKCLPKRATATGISR